MTRFLDSLSGTLAGMLIGVLLMAAIIPQPFTWSAAPRSAQDSRATDSPRWHDDGGAGLPAVAGLPARSGAPWPELRVAIAAPSPSAVPVAARSIAPSVTANMAPAAVVPTAVGIATWFNSPAGVSAAGPDLRAFLGPGWRGATVRVCHDERCVLTVVADWMAADRLIDLDDDAFARLAQLSVGVLRVTVTAVPAPPETSADRRSHHQRSHHSEYRRGGTPAADALRCHRQGIPGGHRCLN